VHDLSDLLGLDRCDPGLTESGSRHVRDGVGERTVDVERVLLVLDAVRGLLRDLVVLSLLPVDRGGLEDLPTGPRLVLHRGLADPVLLARGPADESQLHRGRHQVRVAVGLSPLHPGLELGDDLRLG
jgi:hypothetical protein